MDSDKTLLKTGEILLRCGRKDNFHAEGVALLLDKRVQKSLIGWDLISKDTKSILQHKQQKSKDEHR